MYSVYSVVTKKFEAIALGERLISVSRRLRLCYNAAMEKVHKPPHPIMRIGSLLSAGPRAVALRWLDQIYRRATGAPVWALSAVTPQLLLGGQHFERGYQRMREFGISAIVNMRKEHCDQEKGIAGERHLHLATVDNTPPTLVDLRRGSAFIRAEIERGGKVYIHCAVGCGRAPTMTAAYLVTTGLSPEAALQRIKRVRPFIHLTRSQKHVLHEFAAQWGERPASAQCQN